MQKWMNKYNQDMPIPIEADKNDGDKNSDLLNSNENSDEDKGRQPCKAAQGLLDGRSRE